MTDHIEAFALQDPKTGHYVNFSKGKDLPELDIRCLRTKKGCESWKRSYVKTFGFMWAERYQLVHVKLAATIAAFEEKQ